MTVELHKDDLPPGRHFGHAVAIDTETLGLNPYRDRLCLVQLSRGDGNAELVQLRRHACANTRSRSRDREYCHHRPWRGQPITLRQSLHDPTIGYIYLNGEILCQVIAQEVR